MTSQTASDFARALLDLQYQSYSRILARKHGIAVSQSLDETKDWSDEQLASYVEAMKDLSHLPPA